MSTLGSSHRLCSSPSPAARDPGLRSTERFRWVCASCESLSWEQLCVGVCQGPAVKAQKAAALPPTSLLRLLTAPLACLIVLRLHLGCCRVLEYKERTLRRWTWQPLCNTCWFFSYSYDWWVIKLILLWNILVHVERATVALLWNFFTVGEFLYSWWHFSTYASKYSTNTLSPFILPVVTTQMCSFKCPDLAVPLGRDHLYAVDLESGTMKHVMASKDCKALSYHY